MKVLVIIVSYNFVHWIDRCLGSLQQSSLPVDVMVIDNGSTDFTVQMVKKHYPEVRMIENRVNLGFGQANNIGLKIAIEEHYDGVFLLNQDAWIDKDTIKQLVEESIKHQEYGILSPVHLTGERNKIEHGFACYTGLDENDTAMSQEDVKDVPFINAAIWYIPVSVLKRVGVFAPLFYHYGEDKDYANRIHHFGYKIGYVPGIYGCHDRAFRKTERKDFLRAERVYLLSEYANINYSFGKAFAYGILAGCKKAYLSLKQTKMKDFCAFVQITCTLLLRTNEVLRARKEAMTIKE